MKLRILIASALLSASFNALADVPLTQADLLGVWQIEKEAADAEGGKGRPSNALWDFRADGTMEGTAEDHDKNARINQMRAVLNYNIENGKLNKQIASGRAKMESCTAVKKEGSHMVLKCQFVYFFMNKK